METGIALKRRSSGLAICDNNILKFPVIVWDNIMECNERCVVSSDCSMFEHSEKCVKMAEYFNHILDSALTTYGSYMNEKIMVQIGLQLSISIIYLIQL